MLTQYLLSKLEVATISISKSKSRDKGNLEYECFSNNCKGWNAKEGERKPIETQHGTTRAKTVTSKEVDSQRYYEAHRDTAAADTPKEKKLPRKQPG